MTPESPVPDEVAAAVETETGYIAELEPDSREYIAAMAMLEQLAESAGPVNTFDLIEDARKRSSLTYRGTKQILHELVDGEYIERPELVDRKLFVHGLTEKGEDFFTAPQ